ncbi:hypothetical protein RFI_18072 [Reticulomyxa filosa]|uniref:Uncharacterized protein n=1 Tax=Reticulomyxa filosa TaxID=46433 RepID=X6MYN6_RETFI|nr:hypothetical protein RFI_18072 [Reticulomyxa filosa]|eukprot:ETO19155.1 hypothetical protein RFI_18072 [Reticulomyxa filosa]
MPEKDNDGDVSMSASKQGIRMGVEPQMDTMIFDTARATKQYYDTSIDPTADEDEEMGENERQMLSKKPPIEGHAFFLKDAAEDRNGPNNQEEDDLTGNQKSKQIISRLNEYQQRYLDRAYTPARADPFATPALQHNVQANDSNQSKTDEYSKKLREEALKSTQERLKSDGATGRSYKDIMFERKLEEQKAEVKQMLNDVEVCLLDIYTYL